MSSGDGACSREHVAALGVVSALRLSITAACAPLRQQCDLQARAPCGVRARSQTRRSLCVMVSLFRLGDLQGVARHTRTVVCRSVCSPCGVVCSLPNIPVQSIAVHRDSHSSFLGLKPSLSRYRLVDDASDRALQSPSIDTAPGRAKGTRLASTARALTRTEGLVQLPSELRAGRGAGIRCGGRAVARGLNRTSSPLNRDGLQDRASEGVTECP